MPQPITYDPDEWEPIEQAETYDPEEWEPYDTVKAPPEPEDDSWNITRGLKSGLIQTAAVPPALGSMFAKAVGDKKRSGELAQIAGGIMGEAEKYSGDTSFGELIDNPTVEGATDWAMHTIGNFAPSMATGFGGAVIGSRIATKVFIKNAIKQGVKKGLTTKAATEAITKQAINKVALRGAGAGLVTSTAMLEGAPMYMEDVKRHGVEDAKIMPHVVGGALAGLVELGIGGFGSGHYRLIKKFFGEAGQAAAKKSPNAAMRMLKEIGKQSGGEAFQELTQEEIAIANEFLTSTDKERAVFEYFGAENMMRAAESAAGGGIMGVLGGGASGLVPSGSIKETAEKNLSDTDGFSEKRSAFIETTKKGLADGSVTIDDVRAAKAQHESGENPDLKISATFDNIIKDYEQTGQDALKAIEDFKNDIRNVDSETALDFKNELIKEYPHLEDQANEAIINEQPPPPMTPEVKEWKEKRVAEAKPEEIIELTEEVKPEKAKPTEAPVKPEKAPEPKPVEAKRGERLMAEGETEITATGRKTSPFPRVDATTNRKTINAVKRSEKWLIENAIEEAKSRKDEFNLLQFENVNLKNLSQADKDSAHQYLFGDEQPTVPKPFLKDLKPPEVAKAKGKEPWEMTRDEVESRYPKAKDSVDGRIVRDEIPNQDSISASIDNSTVLDGVRDVPMSEFDSPPVVNAKTKALAKAIKESGEVNPLIVVVDKEGAYILEGANRYDALKILKAKSIPAQVVLDEGSLYEATKQALKEGKPVPESVLKDYPDLKPTPEVAKAKEPWEMTRVEHFHQENSKTIRLPSRDGYAELPRTHYIRFGRVPVGKDGKPIPSTNWLAMKPEKGVSVFGAWKDPKTGKYVISAETDDMLDLVATSGITEKKVYAIDGDVFAGAGADGEPLIRTDKNIKSIQINSDEIVTGDDPNIAVSGKELDEIDTPNWNDLGPTKYKHPSIAHKESVKQALKEGKPVPESVLKDYPDLKPTPEVEKTGEAPEGVEVKKSKIKPKEIKTTGNRAKTYLGDNTEIDIQYAAVDVGDLITSHDDGLVENPNFPKELQPRDRNRKGMRLQINNIVNTLNPERMGESSSASTGAPIMGQDLIVESGNGRTIAIRKAYEKNSKYKDWLTSNAEKFGLKKSDVENIAKPVLVRVRKTDLDRVEFVKKANKDEIARMSPVETAKSDAGNLTDGDISIFEPSEDGNISTSSNTPFINRFIKKLGTGEAAGYLTEDGRHTKQLIDRIQAAIFYRAYGDEFLLTLQAEESDPNIKNILNALTVASPGFIKAQAVDPNMGNTDIISHIVGAAKIIQRTRSEQVPVKNFFEQLSLFEKIPQYTKELALFIDNYKRSGKKMGAVFKNIALSLRENLIDRTNNALPGFEKSAIDPSEIINSAIQKMEAQYEDKQRGLFEGAVKEGGRKGERYVSRRSADEMARDSEELKSRLDQVKEYEIKEPSKAYQQLGLTFKSEKGIKRDPISGALPQPSQRVRMATTGHILAGGTRVHNIGQAASLLAHIRKSAQELLYIVAVDKDSNILEIHRYSKGMKGSTSINSVEVAGRVFNIPNASKVYIAHNHPGGDAVPSNQDIASMHYAYDLLKLRGIESEAIVVANERYSNVTSGIYNEPIPPSKRTVKIPEKERHLKKVTDAGRISNNETAAREVVNQKYGGKTGFLFLNPIGKDIGFLPYTKGMRTKDVASEIMAMGESINAHAMIFYSKEPFISSRAEYAKGRREFLKQLKLSLEADLTLFDAIDKNHSMVRAHLIREPFDFKEKASATTRLDSDKPLYQIGEATPIVGNESLLDVLRKSPPLKTATMGLSEDGSVWVRNSKGQGFTVKSVKMISPDKAALELGHGRMLKDGEFIKGKYQDGVIELQRDLADEFTVSHESMHMAEDLGFISPVDVATLKGHIKRQARLGKWDSGGREVGGAEDRAIFATKFMKDRSAKGPVGKVLQKIAGFIDAIVNLFKRTAKGMLRDIESGKAFERETGLPKTTVPAYEKTAQRWYSQMTKVLSQKLPGKGTPGSYASTIEGFARKGEFKAEELSWSGVLDWLKEQKGKLTKQDVLDYLAENNVGIEEVEKGGEKKPEFSYYIPSLGKRTASYSEAEKAYNLGRPVGIEDAEGNTQLVLASPEVSVYDSFEDAYNDAMSVAGESGIAGDTKFSQYVIPGGENYRELLLTLPVERPGARAEKAFQEKVRKRLGARSFTFEDMTEAEVAEYNSIQDLPAIGPEYRSSHWEEPNVLAHIRFDERTGQNGERILHIAEIQSDYGQDYRKQLQNIENYVTNHFKEIVKNMEKTGTLKEIC